MWRLAAEPIWSGNGIRRSWIEAEVYRQRKQRSRFWIVCKQASCSNITELCILWLKLDDNYKSVWQFFSLTMERKKLVMKGKDHKGHSGNYWWLVSKISTSRTNKKSVSYNYAKTSISNYTTQTLKLSIEEHSVLDNWGLPCANQKNCEELQQELHWYENENKYWIA